MSRKSKTTNKTRKETEYIHIQFLIEDQSGKCLIEQIMQKYISEKKLEGKLGYEAKAFKGIGTLRPKARKKYMQKTQKLLNDLPAFLQGHSKTLGALPYRTAIVVVLDGDKNDCVQLREDLLRLTPPNCSTDVVYCIAIEEMEAWLLGDQNAVMGAYPKADRKKLSAYQPDSIVGTWEKLADIVYKGGVQSLKKQGDVGREKSVWANNIGKRLTLDQNRSPSFQYLLRKLDGICS